MTHRSRIGMAALSIFVAGGGHARATGSAWDRIIIGDQTTAEQLATLDLQRYIAQVTGRVPVIMRHDDWQQPSAGGPAGRPWPAPDRGPEPAIVIGTPKSNPRILAASLIISSIPGPEGYYLIQAGDTINLVGFTPQGVVNAVYGLLREAGFGFYLGSEAVPERLPDRLEPMVTLHQPALAIRGVLPWYNFFNSPTTWDPIDHRTLVDQLIRQGANFVGFHTYDNEPFAAIDEGGHMTWGGRLLNTSAPTWGTHPLATSRFAFGSDLLFPGDFFGAASSLDGGDADAAIRREQAIMRDALDYANKRGLHTCLGFEISGDPTRRADRDVFLKRINHLLDQYPAVDYVWIWEPETQGAQGFREQYNQHILGSRLDADSPLKLYAEARRTAFERVVERTAGERPFFQDNEQGRLARAMEGARLEQFARLAHRALARRVSPPRLVVSGWGGDERLLSAEYYDGLDMLLPEDVVFASLDHIVPRPRVDHIYHELPRERQRWPIPWLEYDGDQWHPQPFVHTFEPMMRELIKGGSQGVLGIHWRTREVEENFGYLVAAAWEPGLTAEQFFRDLARRCYPGAIASDMAAIHSELDGLGYRWVGGGGQGECAPFTWGPGEPEKVRRLQSLRERAASLVDRAGRARQRLAWVIDRIDWVLAFQQAEESAVAARDLLGRAQAASPEDARRLAREALARLDDGAMERALACYARRVSTRGEYGVLATINTKAVIAWRDLREQCGRILGGTPDEPKGKESPIVFMPRLYGSACAGVELPIEIVAPVAPRRFSYRTTGGETWKHAALHTVRGNVRRAVIPPNDVVPPGIEFQFEGDFAEGAFPAVPAGITIMPMLAVDTAPRPFRPGPGGASKTPLEVECGEGKRLPVELTWTAVPEADYYRVLREGKPLVETAVEFLADAPGRPRATYVVEAWRGAERIAESGVLECNPPDRPIAAAPHVIARAGRSTVMLSWPAEPSPIVSAYEVFRGLADPGPGTQRELIGRVRMSRTDGHAYRDRPGPGKWRYEIVPINQAGRPGPAGIAIVDNTAARARPEPVLSLPLTSRPDAATVVGRVTFTEQGAGLGEGHLELADRPEYDLDEAMTLLFEFKADRVSDMPVLLCHGTWQIDGWFAQILGGALTIRTPSGDARGPVIEPGRWYAVRFVYDGESASLWVDGRRIGGPAVIGRPVPARRKLIIGEYEVRDAPFAFHGTLRNLTIYPDALLPATGTRP